MVRLRMGALVGVAAIVFAACGTAASPSPSASSPGTSSEPGTSASPSAGGEIKEGGSFIVALPGDIDNTDPALISDSNSSYVMNQVMQGLVGLAPGSVSEIVPVLASELPTVSDDGLTYTFKVREGVKFHDGTALDAAAVKFNYDRWKNFPEELQQAYAYYAGAVFEGYGDGSNVASTEAPDATTFILKLKAPRSNFLIAQTLTPFFISSPAALQAGDADNIDISKSKFAQGEPGIAMIGTGPFKFKEWVADDHVTIEKNADYWDAAGAAHLDEIIFRPFPDQTAEFNAVSSGEVDFAQTVAPADAATITAGGALQAIDRGESCNLGHLAINQKYKPVDNLKIRQAMMHALNRQAYIDAFYAGQAVPADNWMPPATQYYKPLGLPTYDPDKAKALIAEAQAEGVTDLSIDFWYPSDVARPYMPDPRGLFEAISNDLEAVGFTINPNTATWNPDYLDAESEGQYEAWLIGWTCDWAGPDNFLSTAFFAYRDGEPNPEYAYDNDELDTTMGQALSSIDEAERKALWEKAQDLVGADLPTIPLVNSTPPAAAQSYVKGVVGSGALNEYFNTVWLDK